MPKMTGGIKTGRYYIRLPEETMAEIDGYIKESGMYQAYFLSNALIVGARVMARQLHPEQFYTREMIAAMAIESQAGHSPKNAGADGKTDAREEEKPVE